MSLSPGDLVRIYHDGKESDGEILEGLMLDIFHIDHRAKKCRDNNSRWISGRILVDGRPRVINLYWDDEIDLLS